MSKIGIILSNWLKAVEDFRLGLSRIGNVQPIREAGSELDRKYLYPLYIAMETAYHQPIAKAKYFFALDCLEKFHIAGLPLTTFAIIEENNGAISMYTVLKEEHLEELRKHIPHRANLLQPGVVCFRTHDGHVTEYTETFNADTLPEHIRYIHRQEEDDSRA